MSNGFKIADNDIIKWKTKVSEINKMTLSEFNKK